MTRDDTEHTGAPNGAPWKSWAGMLTFMGYLAHECNYHEDELIRALEKPADYRGEFEAMLRTRGYGWGG